VQFTYSSKIRKQPPDAKRPRVPRCDVQALLPVLPKVRVDKDELEDCRWFHR